MRILAYRASRWMILTMAGMMLFLSGCNDTIQSTVEDGIITLSQSMLTAIFRALTNLASEASSS